MNRIRSNGGLPPSRVAPSDRTQLILVPPPRRVTSEKLHFGELTLDATLRRAWRGRELLDLTPMELGILEDLMRHPGAPRTAEQILQALAAGLEPSGYGVPSNPVRLVPHVSRLRRKMDERWPVKLLHTVRRAGYLLLLPDGEGMMNPRT